MLNAEKEGIPLFAQITLGVGEEFLVVPLVVEEPDDGQPLRFVVVVALLDLTDGDGGDLNLKNCLTDQDIGDPVDVGKAAL